MPSHCQNKMSSVSPVLSPSRGNSLEVSPEVDVNLEGEECSGEQRGNAVFCVEATELPYNRPRKRRCTGEGRSMSPLQPSTPSPPSSLRSRARQAVTKNASTPQPASARYPRSVPSSLPTEDFSQPEGVLRSAEGDRVFAALRQIQAKPSLRWEHSPGSPLWAYVCSAYFTETSSLRTDLLNWGEVVHMEAEACRNALPIVSEPFDFQELEKTWQSELEDCCGLSERLLNDLRARVEEATREQEDGGALSITAQTGKGKGKVATQDDTWTRLLHSKRLHPLLLQLSLMKPSSSLATYQSEDDDTYCEICYDGYSCDSNLIVICSGCETAFHVECYGIPEVPEGDWFCEVCEVKGGKQECSICGKGGGDLRRGETKPIGETGWAHVYCVESMPGSKFTLPTSKSQFTLQEVDPRRCQLLCQFCEARTGACLQCSYRSCMSSFHPGCWKSALMVPNSPIDPGFECIRHKDANIQQKIERTEKYRVKGLIQFYKELTSGKGTAAVQKTGKVVANKEEMKELVKVVKKALGVVNYREKKAGFVVEVDRGREEIKVKVPVRWNLMSPEVFREECLTLPGHSPDLSARLYTSIYPKLKKRIKHARTEFTPQAAASLQLALTRFPPKRKPTLKKLTEKPTVIRIPLTYIREDSSL